MRNEVGNEAGSWANGNGGEASSSNTNNQRLKINQNTKRTGGGYRRRVGNDGGVVDTASQVQRDVIDLTGEPELEVLSSTVKPTPRKFVAKKRKMDELVGGDRNASGRPILESHRLDQDAAAISPPKEPEKKNPVCGICLEPMGTNTERPMMAGNCGHVYCRDCLKQAVKRTRQCPSCRKGVSSKQIRNIFIDFD